MEPNEQTTEETKLTSQDNSDFVNAENLESRVQQILNPDKKNIDPSPTKEAPYGYTRDGVPKKRKYKKRKKSAKRKTLKEKIESTSQTENKSEVAEGPSVPETKTEYEKYLSEWENSLDPDAKKDQGPDNLIEEGEGNNPPAQIAHEKPKRKFGNSLVVLTRFVLPVLCTLSTRLISRGKKRPESKDFKLDEFDVEMLKELADDGAGEEMLGGINPAYIYLIVAFALGANKVMDYWDKDEFQAKMDEVSEMKVELASLKSQYELLLSNNQNKEEQIAV